MTPGAGQEEEEQGEVVVGRIRFGKREESLLRDVICRGDNFTTIIPINITTVVTRTITTTLTIITNNPPRNTDFEKKFMANL